MTDRGNQKSAGKINTMCCPGKKYWMVGRRKSCRMERVSGWPNVLAARDLRIETVGW